MRGVTVTLWERTKTSSVDEFGAPTYTETVTTKPMEESEPEPEPEKPPRTVDLAEIRTKAKAARDAGVKLADVWAAFGGSKLSDVPHTKYGELLDMLEEKMQEAGA